MAEYDFPHALARKWRAEYAEHLMLTVSLRELVRNRVRRGPVRELLTDRAVTLLETTDQLASFGIRPTLRLAGAEGGLWTRTVRYVDQVAWQSPPAGIPTDELIADLVRMQSAWDQFEAFVGDLPDDFYQASPALTAGPSFRGEGLSQLFGPRVNTPAGGMLFDRTETGDDPTAVI